MFLEIPLKLHDTAVCLLRFLLVSAYGHSYEVSCEIPTAVRNTSRDLREMKGFHYRVNVMKQKVENRHRTGLKIQYFG